MDITVGQLIGIIAAGLAALVAFLKGVEYLIGKLSRAASKWLQKGLEPINIKLDAIDRKVDESELSDCKNYLVGFLSDVKRGVQPTEVERERFYETYARYTAMGGNSYIKIEVDRLKKTGKL